MDRYDYERGAFGSHKVKISLQKGNHKAVIFGEVGGNIGGASVLGHMTQGIEDNDIEFRVSEENRKYLDFEGEVTEGKMAYAEWVRLYDGDDVITVNIGEDSRYEFEHLMVAVEIVEFIPA